MTDDEVVSKCINDPLELMFSKVPFKGADIARFVSMPWIGQCLIKTATLDHIYPTYVTLFDAAKRGEGFGIDEFPSFNIFKDYFLKDRVVLELTDNLPYSFLTRLGFRNVGCIPKSAYVAGTGYTDAILFYNKPKTEVSAAKL